MNARRIVVGLWALGVFLSPAVAHAGSSAQRTDLTVSPATTIVSGQPVPVRVALTDRAGDPIGGATIRLVTTTTFLGAEHAEIVDEATTDSTGKAVLSFAPVETGTTVVNATFEGDGTYGPAESSTTFDVRAPVTPYHAAPVGIQAPWARSSFILVPFLGVWFTYLVVVAQIRKIRRAGVRSAAA